MPGSEWMLQVSNFDWHDQLERMARPAVFLHRTGLPVPVEHPARSYFGGLPKLPPHLSWPMRVSRPLHFAAQIDLSELAEVVSGPLPRVGTLYFFLVASTDSMQGDESRVLYYEGSADGFPAREAPPGLPNFGQGGSPWTWLPKGEPAGCIGFKHPLRFVPIKSYCDHYLGWYNPDDESEKEEDDDNVGLALQYAEFNSKLPLCNPDEGWGTAARYCPFAWSTIEYVALGVLAQLEWFSIEQQDVVPQIRIRADDWLARAREQPALQLCDAEARRWFDGEWQWLQSATARHGLPGWGMELPGIMHDASYLTCCTFAAHSAEAAALIPAALVQTYENATRWMPRDYVGTPVAVHQMLGYGAGVQNAPLEHTDDVLLLQVAGERCLPWFHTYGCVLQIWLSRAALAAGKFEATNITFECD